jgi:hypothetical protein
MDSQEGFTGLPLEERQRLLAKLAKLKALSECKTGNVNETATAAAAMTRLMMEYKIELAEIESKDSELSEIVEDDVTGETRGRSFPGWQRMLLSLLAEANDCVGFETKERERYGWDVVLSARLCLMGRKEDIRQTRTLFCFCILCYEWSPRAPVSRKNDFRRGAAEAIGKKAVQERAKVVAEEQARAQAHGTTSRALMILDQRLAEVHQAAAHAGVRTNRTNERAVSANAYNAGFAAGSTVSLPGAESARLRALARGA